MGRDTGRRGGEHRGRRNRVHQVRGPAIFPRSFRLRLCFLLPASCLALYFRDRGRCFGRLWWLKEGDALRSGYQASAVCLSSVVCRLSSVVCLLSSVSHINRYSGVSWGFLVSCILRVIAFYRVFFVGLGLIGVGVEIRSTVGSRNTKRDHLYGYHCLVCHGVFFSPSPARPPYPFPVSNRAPSGAAAVTRTTTTTSCSATSPVASGPTTRTACLRLSSPRRSRGRKRTGFAGSASASRIAWIFSSGSSRYVVAFVLCACCVCVYLLSFL